MIFGIMKILINGFYVVVLTFKLKSDSIPVIEPYIVTLYVLRPGQYVAKKTF